tara:strand:- start:1511 stop:1852 length:342 start_codon:yes stop_codon:yes gene_type:complete
MQSNTKKTMDQQEMLDQCEQWSKALYTIADYEVERSLEAGVIPQETLRKYEETITEALNSFNDLGIPLHLAVAVASRKINASQALFFAGPDALDEEQRERLSTGQNGCGFGRN